MALLGLNLTNDWHALYCYAAVQALALALNNTTTGITDAQAAQFFSMPTLQSSKEAVFTGTDL